jgi:hypothetical protein
MHAPWNSGKPVEVCWGNIGKGRDSRRGIFARQDRVQLGKNDLTKGAHPGSDGAITRTGGETVPDSTGPRASA